MGQNYFSVKSTDSHYFTWRSEFWVAILPTNEMFVGTGPELFGFHIKLLACSLRNFEICRFYARVGDMDWMELLKSITY